MILAGIIVKSKPFVLHLNVLGHNKNCPSIGGSFLLIQSDNKQGGIKKELNSYKGQWERQPEWNLLDQVSLATVYSIVL